MASTVKTITLKQVFNWGWQGRIATIHISGNGRRFYCDRINAFLGAYNLRMPSELHLSLIDRSDGYVYFQRANKRYRVKVIKQQR